MRQKTLNSKSLESVTGVCYKVCQTLQIYKVRQKFITMCVMYYKVLEKFITKCVSYYKVRQLLQSET